jgi:hypothetical protein
MMLKSKSTKEKNLMSEIKLKIWDKDQKIMSKPFGLEWLLANGDDLEFENGTSLPLNDFLFFKEEYVFYRFTGVKDKNDDEIFEYDVVQTSYGKGRVIFSSGCFMIEWIDDKEALMELLAFEPNDYKYGRPRTDLEIIKRKKNGKY